VPSGKAAIHANLATGVETVFIGVADLDQAVVDWSRLAQPADEVKPHQQPEANKWQSFTVGPVTIVLIEPEEGNSELAKSIAARGEVPIEVALKTSDAGGSAIDHTLSHGAKLALVS
jgi:hypothetical protein